MDAKYKTKTPKTESGDKDAAGATQLSLTGSYGAEQSHKGPPSSTICELTKKTDKFKHDTDAADEENGDFEDKRRRNQGRGGRRRSGSPIEGVTTNRHSRTQTLRSEARSEVRDVVRPY